MFAVLSVLALVGSALAQNPNPCAGRTGTNTFANDWSSCRHYFWCNGEVAVPTTPCDPGFFFADEPVPVCRISANDDANPDCLPCPDPDDAAITPTTFAVAVDDDTCTSYTFCINGVRDTEPAIVCGTGTLFNRVPGWCDHAAAVRCLTSDGVVGGPGSCAPGVAVDINDPASCGAFIQCRDGTGTEASCPDGLHFDESTSTCALPENAVPLCTDPASHVKHNRYHNIPVVPHERTPKSMNIKDRFLRKLHLRN